MYTQLVFLIDYPYFKNHYKLISIDLTQQQKLDADPKGIQHVNFTGNLDRDAITQMVFILHRQFSLLKKWEEQL